MQVLIVDDHQPNINLITAMLEKIDHIEPIEYTNPKQALAWCEHNNPDLVLIDYMMPEMDGIQFIQLFRKLQGKSAIPVMMVTAYTETAVRHLALQASANDCLYKPVDRIDLTAKVKNMLSLRKAQLQLTNRATWLTEEVKRTAAQVVSREKEVTLRLSRAAECRDAETGTHVLRMAYYAQHIAINLGLSEPDCQLILDAAPLHDIGKIGVPDHILLKPTALDDEEWVVMRKHPEFGMNILKGSTSKLLQAGEAIAYSHHEKYDGSGYPQGLAGEKIPLFGRICAIADVFDALTTVRPYKHAWDIETATDYVKQQSGTHFDPKCVQAFFANWENILDIREKHSDIEEVII